MESCRIPQRKKCEAIVALLSLASFYTHAHTMRDVFEVAACAFVSILAVASCGRMTAIAPTHRHGDGPAAQLDTTVVFQQQSLGALKGSRILLVQLSQKRPVRSEIHASNSTTSTYPMSCFPYGQPF